MTTDKLKSIFELYDKWLEVYQPSCNPTMRDERMPCSSRHLRWMCRTAINEMIPVGKVEKAMRWLGYVQGVLVCQGHFSLEDVKRHSMPDDERLVLEAKEAQP